MSGGAMSELDPSPCDTGCVAESGADRTLAAYAAVQAWLQHAATDTTAVHRITIAHNFELGPSATASGILSLAHQPGSRQIIGYGEANFIPDQLDANPVQIFIDSFGDVTFLYLGRSPSFETFWSPVMLADFAPAPTVEQVTVLGLEDALPLPEFAGPAYTGSTVALNSTPIWEFEIGKTLWKKTERRLQGGSTNFPDG
jgi:hypothetical protein